MGIPVMIALHSKTRIHPQGRWPPAWFLSTRAKGAPERPLRSVTRLYGNEALHDCNGALHDCNGPLHDCNEALHDCNEELHDRNEALHDCNETLHNVTEFCLKITENHSVSS